MASLKVRVSTIAFVLSGLSILPLTASQGRGGGGGGSNPPPAPIVTLNSVPADCFSGPGCLDASFGTLGLASADVGGVLQWGLTSAIQPDGKIVAAGVTANATPQYDRRWVIGRFLPDGAVDADFATNGFLNFDPNPGASSADQARKVIILPDGKILVAGFRSSSSASSIVLRLTTSGALDPSFGVGGQFVANPGGLAQDMVLQADGKILVVESYNTSGFKVFRLNPNGSLDTTFGTSGYRAILFGSTGGPDQIALQSTGHILVLGMMAPGNHHDFTITRLTAAGKLDNTFGNKGTTVVDFLGYSDFPSGMSVAADNSIVVAGGACTTAASPSCIQNMAFARFTANGALSPSFGVGGRLTFDISGGDDNVTDVRLQTDGRILFAGGSNPSGGTTRFVFVGRMMANGTLDSSFGAGGLAASSGLQARNSWQGLTLDQNGLISLVGNWYASTAVEDIGTHRWLFGRYFR